MIAERYLVDGRWLEAARIEARDLQLPTVVMLHEGLGSIAHWKDFPSLLAEATGAGVFLYSRYGHGGSDALEEPRSVSYMHHEAQVVLPNVLRQAKIERPVLLGQSDRASRSTFSRLEHRIFLGFNSLHCPRDPRGSERIWHCQADRGHPTSYPFGVGRHPRRLQTCAASGPLRGYSFGHLLLLTGFGAACKNTLKAVGIE